MPRITKKGTKGTRTRTKKTGVFSRVQPISFNEDKGLKVSIYGQSGTGKTTLACTFPKPLLLICAEDGTNSVHNVKGVDVLNLEGSSDIGDIAEGLEDSKYNTVVLDTATVLQDTILTEILGVKELPAQKSWGMATRDQWGQCAFQTKERLKQLLSSDKNVVIIAQEREFGAGNEEQSSSRNIFVSSALSPSVVGWLDPTCDYILQTCLIPEVIEKQVRVGGKPKKQEVETGEFVYACRTGPNDYYRTKFRKPKGKKLPNLITDPDYDKFYELIT